MDLGESFVYRKTQNRFAFSGSHRGEQTKTTLWAHWLSVALDGTVEDEKIKFLMDMSYELTKK